MDDPASYDWMWASTSCPMQPWVNRLASKRLLAQNVSLVVIGDSLDAQQVSLFCDSVPQELVPPLWERNSSLETYYLNTAEYRRNVAKTCNIPGFCMDISCHNGNTSYLVECCQYYNHTYQRIRLLLPMDIFMAAPLPQAVRVGSCLWDLSTGCTDSVNVTVEYQQRYRGAILLIRQAILEVIPGAMSYWRTCPPISQKYSDSSIQNGEGCNRRNQQVLNNILRETANDPILNWWQLFRDVPEAIISHELELDGRHYGSSPRCPS